MVIPPKMMGYFCNKKDWLKKSRFQRNPETWRASTQSLAPLVKKNVIKFLHRAKLAIFRDLVMHHNLFYDENYPCNAYFFADSRILKPCMPVDWTRRFHTVSTHCTLSAKVHRWDTYSACLPCPPFPLGPSFWRLRMRWLSGKRIVSEISMSRWNRKMRYLV